MMSTMKNLMQRSNRHRNRVTVQLDMKLNKLTVLLWLKRIKNTCLASASAVQAGMSREGLFILSASAKAASLGTVDSFHFQDGSFTWLVSWVGCPVEFSCACDP